MKKLYPAILMVAALTACHSEHAPAIGGVTGTSETFTGIVKDYSAHKGKLILNTSIGATCEGPFENRGTVATGEIKCSDGRQGNYTLNMNGTKGTGYGTLNDKAFTFSYKD